MAASEAQKAADARWHKKAYDQIGFFLRKDSEINGEFVRAYAKSRGESVNGFFLRAIKETIERDMRQNK